ncbi:12757_t:CDS:2 [Gigaspora rosea]|nr:12757_t:CDS:2 [Gigaspora rosea]
MPTSTELTTSRYHQITTRTQHHIAQQQYPMAFPPASSCNLQTTPTRLFSPGDKYIIQSKRYPEKEHLGGLPTLNLPGSTISLKTLLANTQKPAMERSSTDTGR